MSRRADLALAIGEMSDEKLKQALASYRFYHEIEIRPGVVTKSADPFRTHWAFITEQLKGVDFKGARVLDVGCRDGLFSLLAEKRGAAYVKGIDNNLSLGATEVVLPALGSAVEMEEENLLHFVDEPYDIVMCFGVLYHLRYPVAGLAALLHLVKPGGRLLIETAVLSRVLPVMQPLSELPLLYCPFEPNPYEPTSVSYFNRCGLGTTLKSLGGAVKEFVYGPESLLNTCSHAPGATAEVRRAFAHCVKDSDPKELSGLRRYWSGTHDSHTS